MKRLCYSVRLKSLEPISDKCYKAVAFDGSEALIPKSQIYGPDYEVEKSEAWWINAWILKVKELQYSKHKAGYYNPTTKQVEKESSKEITIHVPAEIEPKNIEYDGELFK